MSLKEVSQMQRKELKMSRKTDVEEEIVNLVKDKDISIVAQLKPEYAVDSINASINAKIAVLLAELVDEMEGIKVELMNINTSLGGTLSGR